MKRLFGTDGIRAVAGQAPLDPAGVRRFGLALGRVLGGLRCRTVRFALGRDTRESGPWLRDAIACGLAAAGGRAVDAGVITTPGLAWVVRAGDFDGGVMISASHNPFADNGLKVFAADGVKLPDPMEAAIEDVMLDPAVETPADRPVSTPADETLVRGYVAHLEELLAPRRLAGLQVALDCANGSASSIAPEVFGHYGAQVCTIGASPDGRNINLGCGSLHLERLAQTVRERGCDLGLAFDGDADRALAVDRLGRVVDGDYILYLTGRRLKQQGRLAGDAVVGTILSNLWLEQRLESEGMRLHRAAVGDKYVLELMVERGLTLGGEQSGHVIFRDHATTGDGILTGLLLLDALRDEPRPLEVILDGIERCPQVQLNVRIRDKPDLRGHPTIGPAIERVELALRGSGRVVLRYSGTEPVVRVMVEGRDLAVVRAHAESLIEVIGAALGES